MANNDNLKPFNKGYDPRRGNKPKGSKHIATHVRELLEDDSFEYKLPNGKTATGAPIEAMLRVLVDKAIDGDLRAIELLAKLGYGNKLEIDFKDNSTPQGSRMTSSQYFQIAEIRKHQEEKEARGEDALQ